MNTGTDARALSGPPSFQSQRVSRSRADSTAASLEHGSNQFAESSRGVAPPWAHAADRDAGYQLVHARAGDHLPVYHLLLAIFQGPAPVEFQAQLDHPDYQPSDRLLLKRRQRILAHVMISHRRQYFGQQQITTSELMHLATLPEYRGQGYTKALLAAAEQQMQIEQAVVGTLKTEIPAFFEKHGWAICGRHSYSTASPRDILAQIEAGKTPKPRFELENDEPIRIRLWRHVEQDALMRIYELNAMSSHGMPQRRHDYWRWLISRQAYDRVYVAIRGEDKLALGEDPARIVGYSVMKGGRIVELLTLPEYQRAAVPLLARGCSDAIERDDVAIRLDAAPHDPLHQLLKQAGGTLHLHEADAGEVFMARLFNPPQFLRSLAPELHERAKTAGLERPTELGLVVGGKKYCVVVAARSVRIESGRVGRSYLSCSERALTQLLLGHLDVSAAVASGRLEASTAVAARTAAVLFPRLSLWRPPLDDLPAR